MQTKTGPLERLFRNNVVYLILLKVYLMTFRPLTSNDRLIRMMEDVRYILPTGLHHETSPWTITPYLSKTDFNITH
jgi:hypothetical protein